ncbi:intermembrane transport protein PqiB [uncultured Massilia sp.]|uniref:PqiB family protein n=1 Tax=uncultured Massilia sp. TaxID=169973 RepID=UPI0025E3F1D6|nr:MlaD family protein [uncultured Massilia sp.]
MSEQDGPAVPPATLPPPAPPPDVDRPSRWLPSLVWLIPILAAVIGTVQVVNWLVDKGPTIAVSFATGEGLEAGKTKVKYKDVDIGQVVTVKLGPDGNRVVATIEMAKEAARFAAADTCFWVVRPQIGASGVSGLNTLLSGAYIGAAPGTAAQTASAFTGLEAPPAVPPGLKGREYRLHGDSLGSLAPGSPVYYRRVRVGQVASAELNREGQGVDLSVFVEEPYVAFVGTNARWWHASGVDVRLDAGGFKLNTQSLAALVTGGVAFESENGRKPAAPAPAGTVFGLAADRAAALRPPDGPAIATVLYFDQSLRGLAPGAAVDFRGIVLGEVRSVGVEFDRVRRAIRMPVTVDLYPERLGPSFAASVGSADGSAAGSNAVLAQMVARGLRGQLRTGSLLTNQLYIALDFFPNAPRAQLAARGDEILLPTVPGSLDELQSQLSSIASKLDKVPFDDIGKNLNKTLVEANRLVARLDQQLLPEMKDTLASARKTFASAEALLQQDSPLQSDLRQAMQDVSRTMESLNQLADYLERHPESLIRGKAKENK